MSPTRLAVGCMKGEGEMSNCQEVPISTARRIAEEFEKEQVIIVTYDGAHGMVHVTTYGTTPGASASAAEGGNFVKAALGWPDRLCHDRPEWWLKGVRDVEAITKMAGAYIYGGQWCEDGLRRLHGRLHELYLKLSETK